MWNGLRKRVPSALTLLHGPAGLSQLPLVQMEHTGSPRKTGLGGPFPSPGMLQITVFAASS